MVERLSFHLTELGLRAHLTHSNDHWVVMTKYSSYLKLTCIIAYVQHLVINTRSNTLHNAEKGCGPIRHIEIAEAVRRLIRYT